jgi:GNAT superfamily N-acetyltransferase
MDAASKPAVTVRALARADLNAVVAIDATIERRSRATYIGRRLASALREPTLHLQLAATIDGGVAGYLLARVLGGEFGRSGAQLRLELVGVHREVRDQGVGRQLLEATLAWCRRHGIVAIRTAADWRDSTMLGWFAAMGFALAPDLIVERGVQREPEAIDDALTVPGGTEVDYGASEDNHHERLARGRPEVRTMGAEDLREIVRIDRAITGRDRSEYIAGRLHEAMDDAAVRVSLAARMDGAIVYLMARADLGDYGRTEPVAVIDTIGVDPAYQGRGVAHALLRQLDAQAQALQIERTETLLQLAEIDLLRFFLDGGFVPAQRLAFVREVAAAESHSIA